MTTIYTNKMNSMNNNEIDLTITSEHSIVCSKTAFTVSERKRKNKVGDLYKIDTTTTLSRELYTIDENKVKIGNGIFEYCHNCDKMKKLMDYPTELIFYRQTCKVCEFEAQSILDDFTISEYQARFKKWINSGEYLGRSFLGRHLNITDRKSVV